MLAFLQRDDGQDSFEYMLIIGGVAVASVVSVGLLAATVPDLRSAVCAAVASLPGYASFSC